MKITDIQVGKVCIPLKTPFVTALRRAEHAEDLIVKVFTDTGHVGYGNAPATIVVTGDSEASIVSAIRDIIGPQIIGMDIEDRSAILQKIQKAMFHNGSPKAALDIAVHDLFAQAYNMPLYRFFGGSKNRIQSDLTISLNAPEEMVQDSLKAVAAGYTNLKLKVGINPIIDIERVSAIRKAVGPDITIRLDANQGWKPKEAIRTIRQMEDLGLDIELVEQPVKAHDFEGLKQVTDSVDTLIMADESSFTPTDVFRLLSMRACDLINIKLMKAGGLGPGSQIATIAAAQGIECMLGCMLESKVGITAAAALSAGAVNVTKNDLDAADLMAEDPVQGGITYERNELVIPEVPGLGITGIEGWVEIK